MTPHELLLDVHALEEELIAFEKRYDVRSEVFYSAYSGGEEPTNEAWVLDFCEWASVYRTWLERQSQYRDQVQAVQRRTPGLAALVRTTV